jgi:hypothetical protein
VVQGWRRVNSGAEQAEGGETGRRGRRMVRSCEMRRVNGSMGGARRGRSGARRSDKGRWQRGEKAQGLELVRV